MKFLEFFEKWPIVLGFVVGILIVPSTITRQEKVTPPVTTALAKSSASLYLSPPQKTLALGEIFEVAVLLATEDAKVDGVDAVLNYNPKMLKVLEIEKGRLFEEYIPEKVDKEKGRILISGLTFYPREKTGTLGRILFETLKEGATTVFFEFTPSSTTDSNVALSESYGADILKEVSNGRYIIK